MEKYRMISKKGEGTFSEVLKCVDLRDGTYWACKKLKQYFKNPDDIKHIREIQALRALSKNPNILQLHEVIYERKSGQLNLIFELMDLNLYELIRSQRNYFTHEKIISFMHQLLKAVEVLHKNNFFHRDIKPENILIKGDVLKLADFGSARLINTPQPYTEYISTRWYRAPECLLTNGWYSYEMDIWSAGCVMFEIICLYPLFPGANEIDQIDKIHDIIGTPSPTLLDKLKDRNKNIHFNFKPKRGIGIKRFLQNAPPEASDLIKQLCKYDPDQRIDAHKALMHPFFDSIRTPVPATRDNDQDSILMFSESHNNSNFNDSTMSLSKLNDASRISKNSTEMSLISNSTSRSFNLQKKYPYKYSQKYLLKHPNFAKNQPLNHVNKNFSFNLTEVNNKKVPLTNRTNEFMFPKINGNKLGMAPQNASIDTASNSSANTVVPVLQFHANKTSSLNNLISKFNSTSAATATTNLPLLASKANLNGALNASKLHLKYGTNN